MLKPGSLALVAFFALSSVAVADCRIVAGRFSMAQNHAISTTGVSTKGAACGMRFTSSALGHFDSVTVAMRPSHGTLREFGALSYVYKPAAGFKGIDTYSLRLCGRDAAGPGCATVTYNITVE